MQYNRIVKTLIVAYYINICIYNTLHIKLLDLCHYTEIFTMEWNIRVFNIILLH